MKYHLQYIRTGELIMKFTKICAAALAAALMAGTAVTASAEELPLLSENEGGFRSYLMGDLVLNETPKCRYL